MHPIENIGKCFSSKKHKKGNLAPNFFQITIVIQLQTLNQRVNCHISTHLYPYISLNRVKSQDVINTTKMLYI